MQYKQSINPKIYQELEKVLYNSLRCYQKDVIDEILDKFENNQSKSILRQNYTGTGKSVEQNYLAINWLAKSENNSYLFLIHREELLENAAQYFIKNNIPYTYIKRGEKTQYSKRAFLASIEYLKNPKRLQAFKDYLSKYNKKLLIVIDETHHSVAKGWTSVLEGFPDAYKVGFTATPERLDGKGFDKLFEHLILGKPYQWYIDNNFIAPFEIILPKQITLNLSSGKGDKLNEQEEEINKDEILGDAVEVWKEFCNGQKTIAFCPGIKTSKHVVEIYNKLGLKEYGKNIAAHLDSNSDIENGKGYRKEIFRRFSLPLDHPESLLILSNVELFIEGVSVNDCEVVQHLRFTESESYYDQMNGRGNRYLPGKIERIIDHVGNVTRHGLPNRERVYNLKSKKQKEKENKYQLICSNCQNLLAKDYRTLDVNLSWFECSECLTDTLIPKSSRTRNKNEKELPEFIDTEFQILDKEYFEKINTLAMFKKLEKYDNRIFFDKLIEIPNISLRVLQEACVYRGLAKNHAMLAWSRKLSKIIKV